MKMGEELTKLWIKSDVVLITCIFEKIKKVSFNEFDINFLCCVSLPGFTWQCGLEYSDIKFQTLQDKDMILLLEKSIGGYISSVIGNRYVKSNQNKKVIFVDANNFKWSLNVSTINKRCK